MHREISSFHRTKRDPRFLTFLGLSVCFILSLLFMLIGFAGHNEEERNSAGLLIFGVVGVFLFAIFLRGSWMATSGALTHVFTITADEIEWGFMGREKKMAVSEIREIYWDDTDGFNFTIIRKDGKRTRLLYIENVISHKSRGPLLAYIRKVLPEITMSGSVDPKTEQASTDQHSSRRDLKSS